MDEIFTRIERNKLDEVYSFHKRYTGDKRTKYVWEWQYGNINPHPSVLIGVNVEGNLIATQGMFAIKLNTASGVELTGKNESLLIEESYRGTGLSKRLYDFALREYKKEGITCLWGFSRKAIVPLQRAGFKVYFNVIQRSILSLDFIEVISLANRKKQSSINKVKNILKSYAGTMISRTIFLFAEIKFPQHKTSNYTLTDTIINKDDLIEFFARIKELYPNLIHICQDSVYYKWRILDSPLLIISRFLYNEDLKLMGYYYLTLYENFTEVTDLTFYENLSGKILLNDILRIINQKKIKILNYNYNSKNELNRYINGFLVKIGFINTKGPNHFVLLNFLHNEDEDFFNIDNWYINSLWNEGI